MMLTNEEYQMILRYVTGDKQVRNVSLIADLDYVEDTQIWNVQYADGYSQNWFVQRRGYWFAIERID